MLCLRLSKTRSSSADETKRRTETAHGNGTETEIETGNGNGIANFCRQTARRHTTGKADQEQQQKRRGSKTERGYRDALFSLEVSEEVTERDSERKSERESECEDRLIPGIFKCFLGIYSWNGVQYSSQLFHTYRSIMSRHVLLSSVDPSAGQLQHREQQQQQQGKAACDHLLSFLWGILVGIGLLV